MDFKKISLIGAGFALLMSVGTTANAYGSGYGGYGNHHYRGHHYRGHHYRGHHYRGHHYRGHH